MPFSTRSLPEPAPGTVIATSPVDVRPIEAASTVTAPDASMSRVVALTSARFAFSVRVFDVLPIVVLPLPAVALSVAVAPRMTRAPVVLPIVVALLPAVLIVVVPRTLSPTDLTSTIVSFAPPSKAFIEIIVSAGSNVTFNCASVAAST